MRLFLKGCRQGGAASFGASRSPRGGLLAMRVAVAVAAYPPKTAAPTHVRGRQSLLFSRGMFRCNFFCSLSGLWSVVLVEGSLLGRMPLLARLLR